LKNLLFFGNPNSVHDLKVMRWLAAKPRTKVFLLSYPVAWQQLSDAGKAALEGEGITLLGPLEHYSSRNFLRTKREGKRIKALITANDIRCLVVLYIAPGGLWARWRREWKVPILLWAFGTDVNEVMHTTFSSMDFRSRMDRKNYLSALADADAVIAVSPALLETLRQWQPGMHRQALIRTGIESVAIEATKPGSNLQAGRPYILFPRYMRPVYQHELSILAIRLLPARWLEAFTFVFLDREGANQEYIRQISALMEATPQATFLWLPEQDQKSIWSLCKGASLVVMHPSSDGTPVSALEAMACGVPLLLGTAAYDPELFSSIDRLEKNDPAELAAKMERLLRNPPSPAELESVRQHVILHTDLDAEMNKLSQLIGLL
jgi:glycosyltransferase involved in cell wall biosynthesis